MNILIACEESQVVCKAFRDKGHIAFSCDLQECSGNLPQYHIIGNVLDFIRGDCSFYTQDSKEHYIFKWDMLIAFPPCTYFSRVNFFNYYRNGVFNYKRFEESKVYVDLFLKLYNADIKYICIENPLPISIFRDILPPYTMRFQPYEFGEPFTKLTCLWLKNLPYLMPTCLSYERKPFVVINDKRYHSNAEQSKQRSKTFPNVALAMAEQWNFKE